jgi:DNA-directed RNA polymerase specialized sigma24 family protein
MVYELRDTLCAEDGEPSIAQESTPSEQSSPVSLLSNSMCSEMSLPMLAAHCLRELDNYRRGAPAKDMFGIELFRRATIQGDPEAWVWLHHCFGGLVRGWLRCHPNRAAACRLESEENYVALAFERFWQSTASNQRVAFSTLAAALQYLRASLHGTILDTLRAYGRPREVSLPEPGEPGEPQVEDSTEGSEVWDFLKTMLINPREQRIAYLLFHCGLKPREMMRFCPWEFSDVHEIYRLRRNLLERFLRNADSLRWQLNWHG